MATHLSFAATTSTSPGLLQPALLPRRSTKDTAQQTRATLGNPQGVAQKAKTMTQCTRISLVNAKIGANPNGVHPRTKFVGWVKISLQ